MSYESIALNTELPSDVVDSISNSLLAQEKDLQDSVVVNPGIGKKARNSKNLWIPESNWIAGFCSHYVDLANRDNYHYDLHKFAAGQMQYTVYEEGDYYDWHIDLAPPEENGDIRKLSFSLQLSDEDEYEGGELDVLGQGRKMHTCPKKKGVIIFFYSHTLHRVRKVKSGTRRSIVGWVTGPAWK